MTKPALDYRQILLRELSLRKGRNPGYSLRAFARDLHIPASKLSQALRFNGGFSSDRARSIADYLRLPAAEKKLFVALVGAEHARSSICRAQALEQAEKIAVSLSFSELDLEHFKIISEWYHFAILELTEVKGFNPDPAWIADKLGVSVSKVKAAWKRLVTCGLLATTSTGSWIQTQVDLATPSEIPSREIRKQHSKLLHKAARALEKTSIQERDFSAITLASSAQDLPKAKALIKEFRRQFNREMQSAPQKDRVYCISIQFFPLDKPSADPQSSAPRKV